MMIIIIPISYEETGSPVLQDSNLVVKKPPAEAVCIFSL